MADKVKSLLTFVVLILVGLSLLFWGLVQARSFLLPLSVAALLAMIILPVCQWFEHKGLKRGWASFLSDVVIILFLVGMASILAAQVDSLEDDWPQIKQKVEPRIEQLQQYIARKTGLSVEQQNKKIPGSFLSAEQGQSSPADTTQAEQQNQPQSNQDSASGESASSGGSLLSSAGTVISRIFGVMGNFLLILVYTFFFLLYRRKFKLSILKMVPPERQDQAKKIISSSTKVSQNYLFGRILLILFLVVLYSIGLTISGIRNAILISLLAAVLSLLPYIGNVVGYVIAVIMAFISGSGLMGVVGVSVTFAITQFVESYILEPYLVGGKVDLNPVFTIIVVVLGGAIWGIIGMLIAIPILGILKVIFDQIRVLQPLGYLFGEEDMDDGDNGDNIFKKTKRWAIDKFH